MEETMGKRLQRLRKQKGMSQQNLSEILMVTRQTISKWETDQNLPDLNTLLKMAELFEVSIAYIVGVEENNKSISEVYELIQTLEKQQKNTNKSRNRIQVFTIILCGLSLALNLLMTYKIHQATSPTSTPLEEHNSTIAYIHNFSLDRFYRIKDHLYLTDESNFNVRYYDLENMLVKLEGNFYLREYTPATTVTLTLENIDESKQYELVCEKDNLFVFREKVILTNYLNVHLTINNGNGMSYSVPLTDSVPTSFFKHALFDQINLSIPLNDQSTLQLDTLEFDPTLHNTSTDNSYFGYFDGDITFRIYDENKTTLIKEFRVPFNEKSTIQLNDKLPMNTPLYICFDYYVANPNGDGFFGSIGQTYSHTQNELTYIHFMITNNKEKYRIFDLPIYYEEEINQYYFQN